MATTTPTVWAGLSKANVADAPDINANLNATNLQTHSRVIATADGGFFLTWEDWSGAYNSQLEAPDITARRFDVLGAKTGSEFNGSFIYNDFAQQSQAVVQTSDGSLLVAFQSTGDIAFGDLENIDVSIFSGALQGHVDFREFGQQPAVTFANDTTPAIAALSNGRYVVIYSRDVSGNNDLSSFIVTPGLDNNNLPSGTKAAEVLLENSAADATLPDAVTLSNGNYVVTYQSSTNSGDIAFTIRSGTDSSSVASGTVAGGASAETAAQVAALTGGGFVAVWNDADEDGAGNAGVKARVFAADGTNVVAAFAANTTTAGTQSEAAVTGLADGGFLVVWTDDVSNTVKGQRFGSTGSKIGSEFTAAALHDVSGPDLALMSDGRVVLSVTDNDAGNKNIYTTILDPRSNVAGTAGADTLTSRQDGAIVSGLGGADKLFGYAGADVLNGGTGADTMIGGNGNDTYYVSEAGDVVREVISEANPVASLGIDTVVSAVTRTLGVNLETLILSGSTNISGTGNTLANSLSGNTGANILSGLAGNDVINGGLGNDRLSGGTNNDTFIFNTALSSTANRDTITDFVAINDTIRLENAIFKTLTATGTLAAAKFWASTTGLAHDLDDRIIYNKLTGVLTYDSNGSAAGGAVQFAVLSTKPVITNADFFVI